MDVLENWWLYGEVEDAGAQDSACYPQCRYLVCLEAKAASRSHQRPALLKHESIHQTSKHPSHPYPESPTVTVKGEPVPLRCSQPCYGADPAEGNPGEDGDLPLVPLPCDTLAHTPGGCRGEEGTPAAHGAHLLMG